MVLFLIKNMIYETIFNVFNTGILFFWLALMVFPKSKFTQKITDFPWVPLVIAFGYIYFLSTTEGTFSADFSSLSGLTQMFQNANPQGVAAGWLHYLAFDFWVGCWMLKDSQKKQIKHVFVLLPMLCTFMLGPVGIIIYSLLLLFHKKLIQN
tara:strand:- start:195 stop:650 length:456 start_codon:yes stop_codon:yes gene_type:complete